MKKKMVVFLEWKKKWLFFLEKIAIFFSILKTTANLGGRKMVKTFKRFFFSILRLRKNHFNKEKIFLFPVQKFSRNSYFFSIPQNLWKPGAIRTAETWLGSDWTL